MKYIALVAPGRFAAVVVAVRSASQLVAAGVVKRYLVAGVADARHYGVLFLLADIVGVQASGILGGGAVAGIEAAFPALQHILLNLDVEHRDLFAVVDSGESRKVGFTPLISSSDTGWPCNVTVSP